MKNLFENLLASFLTLKPVCDRNNSTWASHTAFAELYARFGEVLTLILALATKTSQNLTGIAQLKKQLRGEILLPGDAGYSAVMCQTYQSVSSGW